jgi:hypothetical protein
MPLNEFVPISMKRPISVTKQNAATAVDVQDRFYALAGV